jgi:CAAX protease family protein
MAGTRQHTDRRPLVAFFALAFGFSWTLWIPLVVLRDALPAALGFPLLLLGSLVPSVVAILLTGRAGGKAALRSLLGRLVRWRVPAAWYLLLLVPTGVTVLAVTLNSTARGGPPAALGVPLATAITMVAFSIFPGSAMGEEIGWRGYALPRLQSRGTALRASLVLGVLTALWHLPLWLRGAPTHPLSLYLPFAVQVVAYAVIYSWLYNGTRGSLLLAVLFHAAANAPLTLILLPLGAEPLPIIFWLISGLTVLWAAVVVARGGPTNLSRQKRQRADDRTTIDQEPARPAAPTTAN